MYDSQSLADRIKKQAKLQGVLMRDMLLACDLNVNAISQISDKKGLSSFSLARIADYLGCSVDYLLGRTDDIGNVPAPTSGELSEHERLVLEAYRSNIAMQSAVDKLLNVPAGGISIAEDISETIRKIEAVSKADIKQK